MVPIKIFVESKLGSHNAVALLDKFIHQLLQS